MFQFLPAQDQLLRQQNQNEQLLSQLQKIQADMVYVAMMTDVEMEDDADEQTV